MSTSPKNLGAQDQPKSDDETFATDISDDEGTSVRQAEVKTDDLSETKPAEGDSKS
jgi:hypothetical protein